MTELDDAKHALSVMRRGMEQAMAREDRNYRHGIREGERRMLWAIAVGADCDCARCADEADDAWASAHSESAQVDAASSSGAAWGFATTCESALRALAARGDEDAARVLGERGW